MKFEQLMEAPLPDDWNKAVFQQPTSFKEMVAYAKERAEQVGRGSSRVAFKIIYQGRPTALKINLNRKGVAQTEVEVSMLEDYYVRGIGITVPLIDYDTANPSPQWIHTEFAEKITKRELARHFGGVSVDVLIHYFRTVRGELRGNIPNLPDHVHDNENFQALQDLALNFTQISLGDLERKANWGLYRGSPVIIDLGLTDEVYAEFYRR